MGRAAPYRPLLASRHWSPVCEETHKVNHALMVNPDKPKAEHTQTLLLQWEFAQPSSSGNHSQDDITPDIFQHVKLEPFCRATEATMGHQPQP
ncbi:hypothetical protein NQZ68_020015 [Dissostichus eleginoides]|nr:hypothetical protein NQZ68_020015 [Dissostichus eleginoides]